MGKVRSEIGGIAVRLSWGTGEESVLVEEGRPNCPAGPNPGRIVLGDMWPAGDSLTYMEKLNGNLNSASAVRVPVGQVAHLSAHRSGLEPAGRASSRSATVCSCSPSELRA